MLYLGAFSAEFTKGLIRKRERKCPRIVDVGLRRLEADIAYVQAWAASYDWPKEDPRDHAPSLPTSADSVSTSHLAANSQNLDALPIFNRLRDVLNVLDRPRDLGARAAVEELGTTAPSRLGHPPPLLQLCLS